MGSRGTAFRTTITSEITRTVKVIVRHAAKCKDKDKGTEGPRCQCAKPLLIYEGDKKANRRVSAKTRSWARAEQAEQELRDSWDPRLKKLAQLQAKKEAKQVRIEAALALYLADMAAPAWRQRYCGDGPFALWPCRG